MLETGGLQKTTVIHPYERVHVGKVVVQNARLNGSLKVGFQMQKREPAAEEAAALVQQEGAQISQLITAAEHLNFGADSLTIAQIGEICDRESVHFVDVEFPPKQGAVFMPNEEPDKVISWRRPQEFMGASYDVFKEAIEPDDIRQGSLGDCWFMCSLSAIAEFPQLVKNVFVNPARLSAAAEDEWSGQKNEHGSYKLRFCKGGEWHSVTVDDFFPCYPGKGPIFSKSHGEELWVLLIEKAYAKLHGNYYTLRGGWAYEGMMDLTGAPTSQFKLDDPDLDHDEMWRKVYEEAWRGVVCVCVCVCVVDVVVAKLCRRLTRFLPFSLPSPPFSRRPSSR